MYVLNRAPSRGRGFGQIARPRPFLVRRGRGFGASGSTAATCTSPNYWDGGLNTCCAPVGTAPADDPCSILNNPAFLSAQETDTGPIGSESGGVDQTILNSLAPYSNEVQQAALNCWSNPGLTYTDNFGNTITCPSPSLDMNGIEVSSYSQAQLAQMLQSQATASPTLAGNSPYAVTPIAPNTSPLTGTPSSASSYPLSVRLVNNSGGSNSSFNVGDSWQIVVTGPPNSKVTASAMQNGTNAGTNTVMGTIGANGQLVLTDTFAASQVGNWTETWMVGNQSAGSISFSVASPSQTSSGTSSAAGGSSNTSAGGSSSNATSGSCFSFYSGDTCWGPVGMLTALTIGGVALAGMFLLGGRR